MQVESVKLSSESANRSMEAELAHARREVATIAANHKNDLANWQVKHCTYDNDASTRAHCSD